MVTESRYCTRCQKVVLARRQQHSLYGVKFMPDWVCLECDYVIQRVTT